MSTILLKVLSWMTFVLPAFGAHTEVIPSGRDSDVLPFNQDAVYKVDDALDLLGISRAPHRLEFVPSAELAQMAAIGGPAVGHWHDGSVVAHQARHSMGVMEFVTPGNPTNRSFYSDGTEPAQQIEIFKHVGGHNDMASNSFYCKARFGADPISSAHEVFDKMETAYREQEFDEVAQWYQYLQSFEYSQDMARGGYDAPDRFNPSTRNPKKPFPLAPTASELQFMVHNLPLEVPQWKKELVEVFERMKRMYGYMVQTKIMNEGWATFVQELLVPYLPWHDTFWLWEAADLKMGVCPKELSNPYWTGREAWRNLYRQFYKRKHLKKEQMDYASMLRIDQEFVKYAHDIMAVMGDYEFLRLALNDQEWIRENHLYLYRKAEDQEQDPSLPPPQDVDPRKPIEQKIVSSTRTEDVANWIAKKLADRTIQLPSIKLENMGASGRNVYSLVHEVIEGIPLKKSSAVKSLYVRSQVWQRPVSLKTVAPSSWIPKKDAPKRRFFPGFGWWPPTPPEPVTLIPIRIEVDPSGTVQVFQKGNGSEEILNPELTAKYQTHLESYKEDLEGSMHEKMAKQQKDRFAPILAVATNQASQASMSLVSHSLESATAIMRYHEMLERRLLFAIKRAMSGKAPVKKTKSGVRIRVLPEIPQFELDTSFHSGITVRSQVTLRADNLGNGPATPSDGDRFWGDAEPPSNGGGEGEDGEGEEDQSGEGEKQPSDGTQGDGDPSEVEIPLDVWGEFLNQDIELPRLKPKKGENLLDDSIKASAEKRPQGEILWDRTLPSAIGYGSVLARKNGMDPRRVDKRKLIQDGMKYIQSSDWVVASREIVPSPVVNAVVVIWMDMTGSMMGEPVKMAKEFIFNLKALLSTKYKNLTFRYVGFNHEGKVYENEETFFKSFLGGGTNYAAGIEKTREVLRDYDPAAWDRYAFGIGDAEDGNPTESSNLLRELTSEVEFSGFVETIIPGNHPEPTFMATVQDLSSQENSYFRFGILQAGVASAMEALKNILGRR